MRALLAFGAVTLVLGLTAATEAAPARPRIEWVDIAVPEGGDAKRVGALLRGLLKGASRHADWGKGKRRVWLGARVTKLQWQEQPGVVRLELGVVGRIAGGSEVRSRIRVGGRPGQRRKLEQDGLRIVAEGLVNRLAEIVRRD